MSNTRKKKVTAEVRVVTFNVHHGTNAVQLKVDLAKIEREGDSPDVYLMQEFKPQKGHGEVFRKAGFDLRYFAPEFAIAWSPERFEFVGSTEWTGEHEYWARSKSLTVELRDKTTGRSVQFTTYHPPAHVQSRDHDKFPEIWPALTETDRMWDLRARNAAANGIPYIAGGDDNVDEERGWVPRFFDRMTRGAARQVRPNEPTHHNRKIDDFRINRLVKVVRGSKVVIDGLTSDHDAFACTFRLQYR